MTKWCWWLYYIAALLPACQPAKLSEADFYRWMNNPDNGLVQSKKVNDLRITVKYLPPQWLTYREEKSYQGGMEISNNEQSSYQSSHVFLLTIQPDAEDIMYHGVADYVAYKERIMALNFHLEEYVQLRIGERILKPVLHTLEDTYGVAPHRNVYIVFADEQSDSITSNQELDFVLADQIFNTGISHFVFSQQALAQAPAIIRQTSN